MNSIKQVLMRRDGLTEEEADDLILQAKTDLLERVDSGETPFDICQEWFGLEPDYLEELI
jgi:hypothetical protein